MEIIRGTTTTGRRPLQGEVNLTLFGTWVQFAGETDTVTEDYAAACATFANSLPERVIETLCIACIRYCNVFLWEIGEPQKTFKASRDVLSFVTPRLLIVPSPPPDREPVLHMELDCEWEPEHGMEWIVRGSSVLYVGGFDGQDPWAEFTKPEESNYAQQVLHTGK